MISKTQEEVSFPRKLFKKLEKSVLTAFQDKLLFECVLAMRKSQNHIAKTGFFRIYDDFIAISPVPNILSHICVNFFTWKGSRLY